ncbi:signal peptide peptidase SppA [Azospirillum canadense]|uniref:signal peptide peptidase SppA n=1 Tax=Azospirillum canadense TaxID=403962 RepID=UPI00222786A9|nr:signal peptide peptidase SppA [Azospirillum canadense]MCW2236450.1 protease-4 [Azospirillum canadense]
MLRFIVRLFAAIGFLVVAAIVAAVVLVTRHEPTLPDNVVLELDLKGPLAEGGAERFGGFLGHETTLREVLDTLERGRTDPRVKGLLAHFGGDGIGFAQAQELRGAIERFRASGRFAIAFAEAYGDSGSGNRSYLLASAFDEVWLQPLGLLSLTGLSAQVPFARGALDKLDVQAQLMQREEFKSFADTFTKTDFTPAHREMVEALLGDLTNQVVDGVAKSRRLAPAAVRAAMDKAPLLDKEALDAKLVDKLGYADEAKEVALRRADAPADSDTVSPKEYLAVAGPANGSGPTIAMIHAAGTITSGKSDKPGVGEVTAGAETIVQAIEDAAEDSAVKAILFRIDSGGGGVTASETIRRALTKARESGKPVIASMGDTAASGGYWIALAADRIVASPGTITGSIGVVAGKMSLNGLSERLGVHWGVVDTGRNAGMWSPLRPFSPSEEERLTAIIDASYATFLGRVAEARHMTPEQARAAAKGRVWSGAQARELGLVDDLGGVDAALRLAKQAAKLDPDAAVTLKAYPKPKSLLQEIRDLASGKGDLVETAALLAELRPVLGQLSPLVQAARSGGVEARMPPMMLDR